MVHIDRDILASHDFVVSANCVYLETIFVNFVSRYSVYTANGAFYAGKQRTTA